MKRQSSLPRRLVVHQNVIGMKTQCESQCLGFSRVEVRAVRHFSWNHYRLRTVNPRWQRQTTKPRVNRGQPIEFMLDCRRNPNLNEKSRKQPIQLHMAEIQQHRSIRDNDHSLNRHKVLIWEHRLQGCHFLMQIIHRVGADLAFTQGFLKSKQVQPCHRCSHDLADSPLSMKCTRKFQPHLRLGHMPQRRSIWEIQSQCHGQRITAGLRLNKLLLAVHMGALADENSGHCF